MFSKFSPILIILSVLSCEPELKPATTHDPILDLSGNWEIETIHGDIPERSSRKYNPKKTVLIPSNLIKSLESPKGSILLRKRIFKTEKQVFQNLCLGKISDQAHVFFNGTELKEALFSSYQNSTPQGYDRTRIYAIPQELVRDFNTIEVWIKPYFDYEFGILSGPIFIGSSIAVWKEYCISEIGGLLLFSSFLMIGGFFLFLSFREKKKNENFYFGLFLATFSVYQISLSQFKYLTGLEIIYLKKLEYSFLVFLFPLFCRFLASFLKKPISPVQNILEIVSFVLCISFWFLRTVSVLDWSNRYLHQWLWLGYIGLSLRLILPHLKKQKESRKILFGILFLIGCVSVDILSERGNFSMIRLSGFGVSGFLFFLTLILAEKFVGMKEKLKTWNLVLEEAIRKRTKELTQSLQEIRTLKEQQDGDYFLITLLFQPFLSKDIRTDFAEIEVYRKQYKQFQFKNRNYEIGGDVVLNETVFISGVEYQVLINADAMGKSLQGASGALVFCSIVKSFLQTPDYEYRSPENWLFLLYKNLQTVFECFDGSMLVSSILSLYRQETGDLFYLNCEHPPILLVRNQTANYLPEESILRKIGFPDLDLPIRIQHFKVLPEDTILYGSDGREDLYLSVDSDPTQRQKVSSPELFLKTVQNPISNLEVLEKRIRNLGELSDDLSLLKIQRSSQAFDPDLLAKSNSYERMGKDLVQKGEFRKALSFFAKASVQNPANLHLSKTTLLLAKKTQNFKLIRLFSEKLLLRTEGLFLRMSGQVNSQRIADFSGRKRADLGGKERKKAS
ncbi:SpoIIE family protein phosphatase [Leptospira sp. 201903071]|uniref:SpoIIE family protein phosphatase n=1 Tax=Leptospira ainazelensis TaxID=2810034 RepID=UPI0019636030|nr:SpoIIE family protein phosphatase [Leptospira ainazelensis]MBM9501738.1 SpoIIE family protein phosphatase [Leptospira ainazelensis]